MIGRDTTWLSSLCIGDRPVLSQDARWSLACAQPGAFESWRAANTRRGPAQLSPHQDGAAGRDGRDGRREGGGAGGRARRGPETTVCTRYYGQ